VDQAEKEEMNRLVTLCKEDASLISRVRPDWQSSVRSLLGSQWSPYDICADQAEKEEMNRLVMLCKENASLISRVRPDWQSSVRSLLGSLLGSQWSPYDICADQAEKEEMKRLVMLCKQNASLISRVRPDWQSSVRSLLGSLLGSSTHSAAAAMAATSADIQAAILTGQLQPMPVPIARKCKFCKVSLAAIRDGRAQHVASCQLAC
jgi:FtsZ-binding cell division protein ZapB